MTATATLADRFRDDLGERVLSAELVYDDLVVTTTAEAWPQVARYCKEQLGMAFFDWLSAVDEREDGFALVCRLYDHVSRASVLLRAAVPGGRDEPRMPTITDVYAGANWHERETYDMFGIVFEDHPGLLPRILTVENFEGWPLRKEFRLASRDVKPWPGAKEPGGDEDEAAPAAAAAPAPGADPEDRAAAAKAKAERAKAKAAEARKRKAAERAAAGEGTAPGPGDATAAAAEELAQEVGADDPRREAPVDHDGDVPETLAATPGAGSGDAEPGSTREAMAAAAGQSVPEGTPDPTTPEGAAEVGGTHAQKDAAAGVRDGDTAAPPPGDDPGVEQPQDHPDREAAMAEGGDPADQQPPGVQPEGTTDLASSTARQDVSDEADPDDVAARDAHGVGPGTAGTFAESQPQGAEDASNPQAGAAEPKAPDAQPVEHADDQEEER